MARIIHDLAVAHGKEHQGTVDIEVFEAGANAVLEEIEQELPKSDKQLNDYGKALLWRINKCIKELKDE